MKAYDKGFGKSHYALFVIIVLALIIKLSLFAFAAINAPQGRFLPDSHDYLRSAATLASKGVFAVQDQNGILRYEAFRTPGYPIFLAVFHGLLRIPLAGIILLQIALTIFAALLTYKAAFVIDERIALPATAILLLDPPITIFSLIILTETLFLFLLSLFMLAFTLYLRDRKVYYIILSGLTLSSATYVRPISYYLGFAVALFMIYANKKLGFKRMLGHALIFMVVVYYLAGAWQTRNYIRTGQRVFSTVESNELAGRGLFKSYARNTDPYTKGMPPLPYYTNVSFRCLLSLMTRPGNFKYFRSDSLAVLGNITGYFWMALWLSGFIWGVFKIKRSIYLQFMLFVILYFVGASIGGVFWNVGERFRVPMMPFIAIISAYGWKSLISLKKAWAVKK